MKYPLSMKVLHWLIASMIVFLGGLGWYMTAYDHSQESHDSMYYLHKSVGFLVLILMCIRLTVRRRITVPPLPVDMSETEKRAATISHKLLYVLALAVPVLGYIQVNAFAGSHGAPFFFFELPQLVPDSDIVFAFAHPMHKYIAYGLLIVAAIHATGALKHRLFDKKENDVLNRML